MQGGTCTLCERQVSYLTKHHLLPKMRHNKRVRRDHGDAVHETTPSCRDCHRTVHALFSEKRLERELNTIELLKAHPDMAKYLAWVRNRPEGCVTKAVRSNDRR